MHNQNPLRKKFCMNESKLNRRQLIITATGASLAALLPSRMFGQAPTGTATASPRASTGNTPGVQTAGNLHTKSLDEISAVLGGAPIVSENGLTKMIDHLVA